MKYAIKILLLLLIVLMTGCTNYHDDPYYLEVVPGFGYYANAERPTWVLNEQLLVPLVTDTRVYGDWVVSFPDGDVMMSIDNQAMIYVDGNPFARWYWLNSNLILSDNGTNYYLLRFDFVDDNPNQIILTQLTADGTLDPIYGERYRNEEVKVKPNL